MLWLGKVTPSLLHVYVVLMFSGHFSVQLRCRTTYRLWPATGNGVRRTSGRHGLEIFWPANIIDPWTPDIYCVQPVVNESHSDARGRNGLFERMATKIRDYLDLDG
uniref:Uncharacterized protein n=1 Tax=Rhizophora mucronata TaxID=61149 RepID=A0A2P2Q4G5_RHIMU